LHSSGTATKPPCDMAAAFWSVVGLVAYVYAGYPLLIWALARLRPNPVRRGDAVPTVSFVIAAYNEEDAIAAKLENTLAIDYPADRFEILVVSDGSTDRTEEIVRSRFADRVRLLALGGRFGKTIGQNRAVEATSGEVIVFSDATTVYRPDTVRRLVAPFADPTVGCVGGWIVMGAEGDDAVVKGRAAYVDYEQWIREQESRFASILGASGAAYAVRRDVYTPLPADVISDMAQVIEVVANGKRSVLEPTAIAYEPGESRGLREELERRTRIMVRGIRAQWYLRHFFRPLRHPWFCFQILSHRLLRLAMPLFLVALFGVNLFLLDRTFFRLTMAGQLAFYGLAGLGWILERRGRRTRVLTMPFYFCAANLAPVLAVRDILRGETRAVWETKRR
jgi:cellulose synthase/poly-beta-1,6-N-acetylglucosamine synthase-like glycosyltransferase